MRFAVTCVIVVLIPLVGFAHAGPSPSGLSGSTRQDFIENAFKVCLQKQTSTATDARFAKVAQYCVCYSNKLADRLSPDDNKVLDELYAKDKVQLASRLRPVLDGLAEECESALRP